MSPLQQQQSESGKVNQEKAAGFRNKAEGDNLVPLLPCWPRKNCLEAFQRAVTE